MRRILVPMVGLFVLTGAVESRTQTASSAENAANQNHVAVLTSGATPTPEGSPNLEGPAGEAISEEEGQAFPDPNTIPYRTKKSPLVHFFSIPAKIWHLAWTPLGATVIWMEQNRVHEKVINFFYLNDEKTAAIFPLISLGGNTGAGAGLNLFHNNLFNKGKRLSASFLYNTSSNNTAKVTYQDSSLFGSNFFFDVTGKYFNDSDENLYIDSSVDPGDLNDSSIGANNSSEEDETSYATEEVSVLGNLGYLVAERVGIGIQSSFRRVDIGRGEDIEGERFPTNILGFDATSLFSIGGTLNFDFTRGMPRTRSGTSLRLAYSYNREIDGSRFEYNRFTVQAAQFLPIPFLAPNRRLAIRGLFEKMDRIGANQIPFYELSMLGDAANLRGFDQNRFRGRGLLLFNFEYRYPVWDTWDAVIFLDEGQVYDDLGDITVDNFHTAVGTGLRFMSRRGFLMRVEVARSTEQWRALFQIAPNF